MTNKEVAIKFLEAAALGSTKEAYENYVSSNFTHHNQYFPGDRKSLQEAMEEASKNSPNKAFSIKQVVEDKERVVTYSHVEKDGMDIAVFHMFRFEEGKIAEMWDVGQIIEPNSPNKNGLF